MTTNVDELPGILYEIADRTLELIRDKGELSKQSVPYLKREFQTIQVEAGQRHVVREETTETEQEEWDTDSIQKVLDEIKEMEKYDSALTLIESRGKNLRYPPDILLREFVSSIMDFDPDDVSSSKITNQISLFVSHIDNSPVSWDITLWLDGIDLEADSINLNNRGRIRKVNDNDLVEKTKISDDPSPRSPASIPNIGPSAILEATQRAKDEGEVFTQITKLVYALRLYDVTSASRIRLNLSSSGTTTPFPSTLNSSPNTPFRSTLSSEDEPDLKDFLDIILPIIEEKIIKNGEDDFLNIAFDRYKSALDDNDSEESRLTSAIMALEALLLKDEEKAELSERLSRRTDILLSFFSYQEIEVSRKVRRAYEIRSRYVHGSKIGEEDISELTQRIMDYARQCLVIFSQIPEDEGKDGLLSTIDRASLQQESKESLKEDLSNWCEV